MRDVYGAKTDKAQWLRFHTQTAGVSLTAQQPDNNIVRTAVEALAAVLAGTNSLHTNALDEVLALPSEKAAQIALRTQQVIAEETGVLNVADPLGGSWYVEALTDKLEAEAEAIFERIKEHRRRRHDHRRPAARHRGRLVHRRDRRLGVRLPGGAGEGRQAGRRRQHAHRRRRRPAGDPAGLARGRARAARGWSPAAAPRGTRPPSTPRWSGWSTARRGRPNTVPAMLDAARAEATLGEICNAFKPIWGEYREAARF